MTQILRQSTQVQVAVGVFVDVGDGVTPETGITLSGADEAELVKANTGSTTSISGNTWAAITGADGWYALTLSTTDTNTVGPLTVAVNDDSVCLPVFARFQVIEEAAYDALYAASADLHTASISDIESSLVIVKSDLVISNSDTTAIHSDTTHIDSDVTLAETNISDIESSLVIVKSDLVVAEALASDNKSSLVIVKSDLVVAEALASDNKSSLVIVKSDLVVIDDLSSDIHSSLVIAKSDLVLLTAPGDGTAGAYPALGITDQGTAQSADATGVVIRAAAAFADDVLVGQTILVHGSTQGYWQARIITANVLTGDDITVDTWTVTPTGTITYKIFGTPEQTASALSAAQDSKLTQVASDIIVIDDAVSDVESSLVIIKSDLVVAEALASDNKSSLVIVKSDLVISNSDTTAIHTQTTATVSDTTAIHSDTTAIHTLDGTAATNISDIESSLVIVKSQLVVVKSDVALAETNISDIESSLVIVKSDLVITTSDTTAIHSDTTQFQLGIIYGTAVTGTLSTTQATSSLTGYADDQMIGRVIVWTSGDCDGEVTDITDYASASGLLTFTALTTAPGNGDAFKII